MHLAAVAAAVVAVQSGVVSPGDPVTVRVLGPTPRAPLPVYLADSAGVRHRLATIRRGRRSVVVRFPQLAVDYYTPVHGRGTLAVRAQPPTGFGPLGASGCAPPSPSSGYETFGTASGAELWALVQFGKPVVGKDVKIVYKLTSVLPQVFYAVSPDGRRLAPDWFQAHSGSTWQRPGFEWGAGFTFDVPGCWRIHAGAWPAQGDLWLVVDS